MAEAPAAELEQQNEAPQARPPRVRPSRAKSAVAARSAARPAAAPASRAPAPVQATNHLAPKRGFIRLLCVQPYTHGHRIQLPNRRVLEDLEGMADLDPKDVRAAVTRYEPGKEYYFENSQAARMLRDKGPARFKNPLTERTERRKDADIYFRVVDRDELDRYLDTLLDEIEERKESVDTTEVNDQSYTGEDEGE